MTPAPFSIAIPFTSPYVFDSTQGNLLLWIETTDQTPVPGLYRIDAALTKVLAEKKHVTRDLGGNAGTRRFTEAIVAKL